MSPEAKQGDFDRKQIMIKLLKSLRIITVITALTRGVPIMWKPQGSHYLTSFLEDPPSCGRLSRALAGLFHCYVYGLNNVVAALLMATVLVCCDTVVSIVQRIK